MCMSLKPEALNLKMLCLVNLINPINLTDPINLINPINIQILYTL